MQTPLCCRLLIKSEIQAVLVGGGVLSACSAAWLAKYAGNGGLGHGDAALPEPPRLDGGSVLRSVGSGLFPSVYLRWCWLCPVLQGRQAAPENHCAFPRKTSSWWEPEGGGQPSPGGVTRALCGSRVLFLEGGPVFAAGNI